MEIGEIGIEGITVIPEGATPHPKAVNWARETLVKDPQAKIALRVNSRRTAGIIHRKDGTIELGPNNFND